jgi:uncharacterized protein
LLRYYVRSGQREAVEMTLNTLRAMERGGIHDQLGGGFHRYSTSSTWLVPHFEKILYDQAQLAIVYAEAYQITHDRFYADTTRNILDFALREMWQPRGGFVSAEDADSPISPGKQETSEGGSFTSGAQQELRVSSASRTLKSSNMHTESSPVAMSPDSKTSVEN